MSQLLSKRYLYICNKKQKKRQMGDIFARTKKKQQTQLPKFMKFPSK